MRHRSPPAGSTPGDEGPPGLVTLISAGAPVRHAWSGGQLSRVARFRRAAGGRDERSPHGRPCSCRQPRSAGHLPALAGLHSLRGEPRADRRDGGFFGAALLLSFPGHGRRRNGGAAAPAATEGAGQPADADARHSAEPVAAPGDGRTAVGEETRPAVAATRPVTAPAPPVTVQSWAKAAPADFLGTAASELTAAAVSCHHGLRRHGARHDVRPQTGTGVSPGLQVPPGVPGSRLSQDPDAGIQMWLVFPVERHER